MDDTSKLAATVAERWRCPRCGLAGQTQTGHERETNLAAHERVVHWVG